MENLILGLVLLIGLQHIGFLCLEMFMWQKPLGRKVFGTDADFAKKTAALAANQGLYNGFLAAGLFWAALHPDLQFSFELRIFFLGCVAVAGLYGWRSVSKTILYVQAIPALLILALAICYAPK